MTLWVATAATVLAGHSFTIVTYNVENLHDADGVAVYDDFQPELYSHRHVITKVRNVASILSRFRQGEGPDIVLLQEIEIDQTPGAADWDQAAWLEATRGVTLASLAEMATLPEVWRDAPAEAWLLAALREAGMTEYHVYSGADEPSSANADSRRAIKCVTLSKYEATAVRRYAIESARNILETEFTIDGHSLYVFNNHWKSGAGSEQMEVLRIQNATVLKERLDALLAADAGADIVIGGDFNAHYNQKARYPEMPRTSMNDVLQAQGSEKALQAGKARFYNLWFELPPPVRGSDVYRGEWGTLMNMVVSRGLYDWAGVQYQDNSFRVARLPGVNADAALAPRRWDGGGPVGGGYSDHLPIYAHFRTVDANRADMGMPLENPSDETINGDVYRVNYAGVDLNQAVDIDALPDSVDLQDGSWSGKLFLVEGSSIAGRRVKVRVRGQVYDIYAPQREVIDELKAQHASNRRVKFYGELGTYKGSWQFVVQDISWVP
ncbi:endonuclease/exonuclease/phosphatase family protein [Actomonas aquatica]|uniref:Endonuclease/exonuclease/phosphatase family protein n=1 Tax=Actomonas aquatica TaxID=2866162 RepID=A0ABZ1CB47_9BACT|nr:endonuclease/exonuclease/phosphatase family protein [Opitutus sp. WL0086]WRQ88728.1 endonuclease/exonuclease/phosphatase family protein [Opitutus sp. WL0086]